MLVLVLGFWGGIVVGILGGFEAVFLTVKGLIWDCYNSRKEGLKQQQKSEGEQGK